MNLLTQSEYNEISKIIKAFHLKFLTNLIGPNYLSSSEKDIIKKFFGEKSLDINFVPLVEQSYLLGKLAIVLGDPNTLSLSYGDFSSYIKKEQYKDYVKADFKKIDALKKQAYLDMLSAEFNILKDIRQSVVVEEGKIDTSNQTISKSISNVSKNIISKIPDWEKRIDKSVSYISQSTFEQGKADQIAEQFGNEELVYKMPLPGACVWCIDAYLTNGVGSAPRIFKLGDLAANGTNIGRKNYDWLPVIGSMHPFCRCTFHRLLPNMVWDKKERRFVPKKTEEKDKIERKSKVKVYIGNKVFEV